MKLNWPWAKRHHHHLDTTSFRYDVCHGCGHLILMGHVENKEVREIDRRCGTVECTLTFAKGCMPNYDIIDIGLDGKTCYYKNTEGKVVEVVGP